MRLMPSYNFTSVTGFTYDSKYRLYIFKNASSSTTLQTYTIIFSKEVRFIAISKIKRIRTQETRSQSTYINAQCKNSRITRFLLILHPVFSAKLQDENVRYRNPSFMVFSFISKVFSSSLSMRLTAAYENFSPFLSVRITVPFIYICLQYKPGKFPAFRADGLCPAYRDWLQT